MKLHLASNEGNNTFTGYGNDYVEVNKVRHTGNQVVTPSQVTPASTTNFSELSEADFDALLPLDPEIVLLGTGTTLRFPHPQLYRNLTQRQIGVEVMDTSAVCRTYNILMSEGRRVVALVLHS